MMPESWHSAAGGSGLQRFEPNQLPLQQPFTRMGIQPKLRGAGSGVGEARVNRLGMVLLCMVSLPGAVYPQARTSSVAAPRVRLSQAKPPENAPPSEYSKEPFVIERYDTTARFEVDGTGEQTLAVRIHVQSDAGAQQLHELVFRYDSANEQIDVRVLRVHKENGTTIDGASGAVTDAAAPTVRDAPAYANDKEKHIEVPPLAAGDSL